MHIVGTNLCETPITDIAFIRLFSGVRSAMNANIFRMTIFKQSVELTSYAPTASCGFGRIYRIAHSRTACQWNALSAYVRWSRKTCSKFHHRFRNCIPSVVCWYVFAWAHWATAIETRFIWMSMLVSILDRNTYNFLLHRTGNCFMCTIRSCYMRSVWYGTSFTGCFCVCCRNSI